MNAHLKGRHSAAMRQRGDIGRPLEPLAPLADASPVTTRANWRWMLGTFLTGIAGVALVGGALFAAFDGQSKFAVKPVRDQLSGSITTATLNRSGPAARKSDKLTSSLRGVSLRQIIHESKTKKIGSKEFFSVKPYARVVASLVPTASALTEDLPPFNPLKLFAEESGRTETDAQQVMSSGSIAVAAVPLDAASLRGSDTLQQISDAEASSLVRESLELSGAIARYEAPPTAPDGSIGGGDGIIAANESTGAIQLASLQSGYSNLTELEPSSQLEANEPVADRSIVVNRGDSLSSILRANFASAQEARAIAQAIRKVFPARRLKEGHELRLAFGPDENGSRMRPVRVSLFDDEEHIVTVGQNVGSPLVYAVLPEEQALVEGGNTSRLAELDNRLPIYRSLFETGRRNGIADSILRKLIRIHAYDVDFKRSAHPGDTLEIFYAADDNEGNVSGDPEILYSSLTVRGEAKAFYRFRTPDDGEVDYYDENGKSAKKFLIRKPVHGGLLRSGFGMRRHPILGYRKMHTGVDWAARRGTPIVAAGNGIVEKAEWTAGYGRYTVIRHANGYKTTYAHQHRFAKGMKTGVKVRQGEVIGYIGSTGLSTGPHLHYEVIVNGRYVDPMRIRVPRGRSLQGRLLKAFQREKTRIDRLMRKEPAVSRFADASQVK